MGTYNDGVNSRKSGGESQGQDGILNQAGNAFVENLKSATGLSGKLTRLGVLMKGGKKTEPAKPKTQTYSFASIAKGGEDPRVKIKIPSQYMKGPAEHIWNTGDEGVVFPYTPQIVVQTRANYNNLNPKDPVAMNLFTQKDLVLAIEKAERRIKRERKEKEKLKQSSNL